MSKKSSSLSGFIFYALMCAALTLSVVIGVCIKTVNKQSATIMIQQQEWAQFSKNALIVYYHKWLITPLYNTIKAKIVQLKKPLNLETAFKSQLLCKENKSGGLVCCSILPEGECCYWYVKKEGVVSVFSGSTFASL